MNKTLLILSLPILLTACAAPKYSATPISPVHQSKNITIVKDDATRAVFLDTMKEWCVETDHTCTVVSDGTPPNPEEVTLTYVSRWSWDLVTFIADADVKALKNNYIIGEVEFKAPNSGNLDKFGDDDKRIKSMMEILFGQQTVEEAQAKISSGEI